MQLQIYTYVHNTILIIGRRVNGIAKGHLYDAIVHVVQARKLYEVYYTVILTVHIGTYISIVILMKRKIF